MKQTIEQFVFSHEYIVIVPLGPAEACVSELVSY
jgi:hypothetical protein